MTSEKIVSKRVIHFPLIHVLAVFTLIISACGEGEDLPSNEGETAAAAPATDPDGGLVEIDLEDYAILMGAVVPSGPVDVRIQNLGIEDHNLYFVMVGSDSTVWKTEGVLVPGETRTATVDLEPGRYTAVCYFAGHQGRGMFTDFVVR